MTPDVTSYRCLLFDLGGVLLDYDTERDTRALAAAGLPPYEAWEQHPALAAVMNDYVNGLIPLETFLPRIRPYAAAGVTDDLLLAATDNVMGALPRRRLEWLSRLRASHRLFLLSNISSYSWGRVARRFAAQGFPVEGLFEQVFLSFALHLAKPDPHVFQHVVAATDLRPSDTLFLDDTPTNLSSAASLGFHTLLVPANSL